MRVLLVIPAYNEQDNIKKVIDIIQEYSKSPHQFDLDYIIINDGSTDATEEICRVNGFKAIHLIQNLGIGGAVQTGYMFAKKMGYDIAVQFDGDGQHDIRSLDDLVAPIIEQKADFVVGSRFLKGTSSFQSTFSRRMGIRFLSGVIGLFTGKKVTDPTSGFRAANEKAISFLSTQYPVDYPEPESIVSLLKNSFEITECQVNMFERVGGKSSIHSWKTIYYMIKVSLAIICTSCQRKVKY